LCYARKQNSPRGIGPEIESFVRLGNFKMKLRSG